MIRELLTCGGPHHWTLRRGQMPQLLKYVGFRYPREGCSLFDDLLRKLSVSNALTPGEEYVRKGIPERFPGVGLVVGMSAAIHWHGALVPPVARGTKHPGVIFKP